VCLEFAAKLCDLGSRRIVEAVIVVREGKGSGQCDELSNHDYEPSTFPGTMSLPRCTFGPAKLSCHHQIWRNKIQS
jgi:hypothetical protein